MRTKPFLKAIMVACIGALASCTPPPATTHLPVSGSPRPDSSLAGRIFAEVTSYRRSRGASELQRHAGLDQLAQEHCEYLRRNKGSFSLYGKNVSHFGFEGRALVARERYQMISINENVAATSNAAGHPASAIVSLWINSSYHEYNMRSDWTHTGIGAVTDADGMVFATQLFSAISFSRLPTRDRFSRF